MIGQMTIAIALCGFNELGRSVTPTFQKQLNLFAIISTLSKNEQKINVGSLKKFQNFCPWDIESCSCKACETMVGKCELVLHGTSPVD